MGGGSWNGQMGNSPAFLDAWSRTQLGFVDPTEISANTVEVGISNAENTTSVYRLWTNGASGSEYFLVENRQKLGYDAALPGDGLLIWHIDENRSGNDTECAQQNNWLCGVSHFKVALEQADHRWDLEHAANGGDNSDPYPGSLNQRIYTFSSSPSSSSYASSSNTFVEVTNISNSGSTMTANFNVTVKPPLPASPPDGQIFNRFDNVTLSWNSSDGAAEYFAEFSGGPGINIDSGWTSSLSWYIGSTWGGTYQWKVKARSGPLQSTWSAIQSLKIKYGSPTGLSVAPASKTEIHLSWNPSPDAPGNIDGYRIYRDGAPVGDVGSSTMVFDDLGLTCGTSYTYAVKAYKGAEESDPSNQSDTTTNPCDYPDLIVETISYQPDRAVVGEPVEISVRVTNQGMGPADGNFYTGLFIDHLPTGCSDLAYSHQWLKNGLAAGASKSFTFTYPGFSTVGVHNSWPYVDMGCSIEETEENNNISEPMPISIYPEAIFSDGFESESLSAWSTAVTDGGDLSVSDAAALVESKGLQAVIDDNNAIYLTDLSPEAEPRYRARFYFDPYSIGMANNDRHLIFTGYQGASTMLLQLELRYYGGTYYLRAYALDDAATWRYSAWIPIVDAAQAVEIDWRAASAPGANDGYLTLWINGLEKATLTALDNDTRRMDQVRLGAVSGIDAGTRGTYYFDAFASRRSSYIGPAFITAAFSAAPTTGKLPLVVSFTNLTQPADPANIYLWDFGDGSTSIEAAPTHTYTAYGDFTVTLTASGPLGSDSEVKTALIHIPEAIFSDGFESGNLSAWSSAVTDGGDLSASDAAALVESKGLQAVIDDNNAIYLTDLSPEAEPRYRARFYFDPNSIGMANSDRHLIFTGSLGSSTMILQLELRFYGGIYYLRAYTLDDTGVWRYSGWIPIVDAAQAVEIDWRAATAPGANDGYLTLWINGAQKASLANLDNDTRRMDQVRLGAVSGIDAGTRGTYYFDAFASRRSSYIGPAFITAAFSAAPTTGKLPLVVSFTNLTQPADPANIYLWDFGDGSTSIEAAPTHTYTAYGDFTVTLTASGPLGSDSEVKTALIHIPEAIFSDGFESGNLSAWSSAVTDGGDLSASDAAALVESKGLQAVIDDNNAIYLTDLSPEAEPRYRARFYFDPNSIGMANNDRHLIFTGYQGASTMILQFELRFYGGTYYLRAYALDDTGVWRYSGWIPIADAVPGG